MKIPLRPMVPFVMALAVLAVVAPWHLPEPPSSGPDSMATGDAQTGVSDPGRQQSTPAAVTPSSNTTSGMGASAAAAASPSFAFVSGSPPIDPGMVQPGRPGAQRVPATSDASPDANRAGLPLPGDFLDRLVKGDGNRAEFSLPDGRPASGSIEQLARDGSGILSVQGRLSAPAAGTFFFQRQTAPGTAGAMVGNILLDQSSTAWRIDPSGPLGQPVLTEVRSNQVICAGNPLPETAAEATAAAAAPGTPQQAPQDHPTDMAIPAVLNGVIPLQSRPGATGVIYLDFDGEPGPFTGWTTVTRDAAPSGTSNSQIREIWQRVAEDYQPFNLNITTDRRIFDKAPENSRQQVIITPTNDAAPQAGGIALIGSFNWTGNTVCWCFIRSGKNAAEAISHEVGHTLGLSHDGRTNPVEEYYTGHGSGETGWAPIMGTGYSRNLTQWAKGEYTAANNKEDDLAIITNNNNSVDFRPDDTTAVLTTADYLEILPDFSVSNEGILETRSDVDGFRFQTAGGPVSLTAATVNAGPNADLFAEIHTSTNVLVASSNPDSTLGATLTATLAPGEYTLRISGVGRGDPLTTGYSGYGSIGAYLISGWVTNGTRHDRFALNENTPAGTVVGAVAPRLAHGGNLISFSLASGNTGGALAIDGSTGLLTVANPAALNYEALSTQWDDPAEIVLFVSIIDSGDPQLNETLRVIVTVQPVNEPPLLTGGTTTLYTRTPAGVPVFEVAGSDPDRFDFPLFSIVDGDSAGAFAIDSVTGQLTTTVNFPTLLPPAPIALTVRATDRGIPALTTDATVTITLAEAPAGYTPGGWMRTWYEGIGGNSVVSLTTHPKFIGNTPDAEEVQNTADTGPHGSNYGSTARAWLIPPFSGNYQFWIASDDASELRLGATAAPGSATVRASVPAATGRYQYSRYPSQQTALIPLTAGVPYYFEIRHKQATGSDHLGVAWQGPGFSQRVLTGAHLAPYRQNYAPRIAPQTFAVRRGADFGASPGTVTATDPNSSDILGSFTITGGTAAGWCAIDAATGLLYIKDPAALDAASASSYSLNVRVSDDASPPLTANGSITLTLLAPSAIRGGSIAQQFWTGLPSGSIASLTGDPRYPGSPSGTRILPGFDTGPGGPGGPGGVYGSRLRAWVIPPVTGSYTFHVAGDDEAQLRFTTGTNYAAAPLIASLTTATPRDVWTTYPSQTSTAFALTAGRKYYLEALHGNSTGSGFVQIAWTGPGMASPNVIPATFLEGFDFNDAPGWPPAPYQFSVRQNAAAGSVAGTVSATDPDGSQLVYSITGGNAPGTFSINPFTGLIRVEDRRALTPGRTFSLSLRVQDNGVAGLYPFQSAATTAIITVEPDFTLVQPSGRTVNLPSDLGLELETTPSGRPGASVAWTKVSGPGTVSFDDPAAPATGARFSLPGLYVIRGTETSGGVPLKLDLTIQSGNGPVLTGGDRIGPQTPLPVHTWDGGAWQITASGSGLSNGPSDSFYFINQPAGPNATITARVLSLTNQAGHHSVAGVMIRESTAADARSLFCGVTSLNGRRLILRSTAGLSSTATATENPPSPVFAPLWLRLTRSGTVYSAFTAPDVSGAPGDFTPLGTPQSFPMDRPGLIGLAASSGVPGTPGSTVIDNLTISPSQLNLAPDIAVAAPSSLLLPATVPLTGSVSDDGLPARPGTTTRLWKKISGPGEVTFDNPNALAPTASFSTSGRYQLRLTADDGEIRSFRDAALTVARSPLEIWQLNSFTSEAADPLLAGDTADPDHDGLPNLVEYALGLTPLTPDADPLTLAPVRIGDQTYLRLSLARNPAATDVQTIIETSLNPPLADSWNTLNLVIENNLPDSLTVRTALPVDALPAQFLRVRVRR